MARRNYCNLHSAFAIEKLPLMVVLNLQWQLLKQLGGPQRQAMRTPAHRVCALSLSF